MKRYIVLAFIFLFAPLYGCASNTQNALQNGFFIWMDGYCAAGVGEDDSIVLSFYYDARYTALPDEDITSVAFEDIAQAVQVSSFHAADLEIRDHAYRGFCLTMELSFLEQGLYKTNRLLIDLKNNAHCSLPIGSFVFDVGAPAEETQLDTWSSPAVTSNAENFVYDFKPAADPIKITSITYAENQSIRDVNGINPAGSIALSDDYNSPIKYIKPKIELISQGRAQTVYSKVGCYCGAANSPDDPNAIIEISKEYSKQNK